MWWFAAFFRNQLGIRQSIAYATHAVPIRTVLVLDGGHRWSSAPDLHAYWHDRNACKKRDARCPQAMMHKAYALAVQHLPR